MRHRERPPARDESAVEVDKRHERYGRESANFQAETRAWRGILGTAQIFSISDAMRGNAGCTVRYLSGRDQAAQRYQQSLRAPLGPSDGMRYHRESFWNIKNRHANWISPRRTCALPDLVRRLETVPICCCVNHSAQAE